MLKLVLVITSVNLILGFKLNNLKVDPIVTIQNGKIEGIALETRREHKLYYAFKGIPYAQPPLGPLRFSPPVPFEDWDDILDATNFKSKCVQLLGVFGGSEDCLYINVFTPTLQKEKLPVMVWIHGGGFILGDSSKYQPDFFLEENVIVVTLNYRFGIFGFLTTGDEVVPGNAGLKDQILALKWVQNNIEAFGGDPKAVTLFGESAGSVSVSYLLQTPLTKALFRSAILESGSSLNLWALSRNKKDAVINIGKFFNITTTDSRELVNELRKIDAVKLGLMCDSMESLTMVLGNPLNGLLFSPSIEPDIEGAVVTGNSYEKLKNGDFQQVPTIIGMNSEEAIMFLVAVDMIQLYLLENAVLLKRFTPVDMNVNETHIDEVGAIIYDEYFPDGLVNAPKSQLIRFISENQFERSIQKMAELQSKYAPVYLYYFSYYVNGTHPVPGAGHGDEISYLWAEDHKDNHPLTKKMVKLWTNFAKTLNPTPEVDPILDNVVWEPYEINNKYLNISENLDITSKDVNTRMQFWKNLYEKYGNPPYDTY